MLFAPNQKQSNANEHLSLIRKTLKKKTLRVQNLKNAQKQRNKPPAEKVGGLYWIIYTHMLKQYSIL